MIEFMLEYICGNNLFDSIFETLSINLFSPATDNPNALNVSSVLATVRELHNDVIKPVALMLVFLYFMIAIVDKLTSENFSWEQLWRTMAMFLAAKLLIDHGFTILGYIFNVGMSLASNIETVLTSTSDPALTIDAGDMLKEIEQSLGLSGFMKVISNFIMFIWLFIPFLLSWIIGMVVKIICYSRIIEIYLRAVFAPIAISDFFHGGLQSGGWRFLKNFLAIGLQGGMILIIASIYSSLYQVIVFDAFENMGGGISGFFAFLGLSLAFLASAVMLMFKSLSLAKEVVGTGG